MRNGFKVFDADTHVRPSAEVMRPLLSKKIIDSVPDLEERREPIKFGLAGEVREAPFRHSYRFRAQAGWARNKPRRLGEAAPNENEERHYQKFMGEVFPTDWTDDDNAAGRLADMDREGSDVHFIVSNGGPGHPDPDLEMEFIAAHNRYLDQFCGHDPSRLKASITVSSLSIQKSIEEINRWGDKRWAVAVHPQLPLDFPLDHPDLNPIWEATQKKGLAVIHHSFATGYPGYRDLWENPFIGRCASHPWAAMRAVASFIGGGVMDRYPDLRFGILESGFGWVPFWSRRMEDQMEYVGYTAKLKKQMSDYFTDGRFFTSIESHEGADMAKIFNQVLGDDVLMFGSDYPHAESRFPESAASVLTWQDTIGGDAMKKMMWDNPVRFFGQP